MATTLKELRLLAGIEPAYSYGYTAPLHPLDEEVQLVRQLLNTWEDDNGQTARPKSASLVRKKAKKSSIHEASETQNRPAKKLTRRALLSENSQLKNRCVRLEAELGSAKAQIRSLNERLVAFRDPTPSGLTGWEQELRQTRREQPPRSPYPPPRPQARPYAPPHARNPEPGLAGMDELLAEGFGDSPVRTSGPLPHELSQGKEPRWAGLDYDFGVMPEPMEMESSPRFEALAEEAVSTPSPNIEAVFEANMRFTDPEVT